MSCFRFIEKIDGKIRIEWYLHSVLMEQICGSLNSQNLSKVICHKFKHRRTLYRFTRRFSRAGGDALTRWPCSEEDWIYFYLGSATGVERVKYRLVTYRAILVMRFRIEEQVLVTALAIAVTYLDAIDDIAPFQVQCRYKATNRFNARSNWW